MNTDQSHLSRVSSRRSACILSLKRQFITCLGALQALGRVPIRLCKGFIRLFEGVLQGFRVLCAIRATLKFEFWREEAPNPKRVSPTRFGIPTIGFA